MGWGGVGGGGTLQEAMEAEAAEAGRNDCKVCRRDQLLAATLGLPQISLDQII